MSDSDSEEGDHCLCHNDAAVSETAFPGSYSPRQQKSQLAQVNEAGGRYNHGVVVKENLYLKCF